MERGMWGRQGVASGMHWLVVLEWCGCGTGRIPSMSCACWAGVPTEGPWGAVSGPKEEW